MITISLCMIVKDEERVIERCLSSVAAGVDEIIIVDTGSSDQTKEIAGRFTDKVYDFTWNNDFSAARNAAYEKAVMDYQMWLDADDVIEAGELKKLMRLKETLSSDIDIVTMKYHTSFDENDNPILTSTRERLTKTEKKYQWQDPVHECIPLVGSIYHSDITISHKKEDYSRTSDRNLHIYQTMEENNELNTPRQMYYYARELKDHGNYDKAIRYYHNFLATGQGWVEDNINACYDLAACYEMIGESEKALAALFDSFGYDSPRPEVCSAIGYYFKNKKEYQKAIDWFQIAVKQSRHRSLGFILEDYRGYVPQLETCVCYYELGDIKQAKRYNKKAGKYKPDSLAVANNKEFFASFDKK